MKIVILGTAYPLRGGIAHFNALLASHLSRRHSVEVITFKRQYPTLFFPGTSQDEIGAPGSGLNVRPAPQLVDSINPFNWLKVARMVRDRRPDLLIMKYWLPFFGPCFGTIAKFARGTSNLKVVYICDNVIPHERRPGDRLFTRYAFRQADGFIVQSDAVERDLLRLLPTARYRKVPHPLYEIFGDSISKGDARSRLGVLSDRVVLFFGYVRAYKGLDILIRAMRFLDDVTLLVVGEFYEDESSYRRIAAETGVGERIRFVADYIPNEKVGEYFCASDVVVLPYRSATQSGIAQIAYNFDKPVIATNVGGLSEVVINEKTGLIVMPESSEAVAQAIRRFYDEGLEQEFVEHVRTEKKKYSWDTFVEAIEELAR